MRIQPSILFVGVLLVLSGCLGGVSLSNESPTTSAPSTTWTPTPGPVETTISPETQTEGQKTPSEAVREEEIENLVTGYHDFLQATSWEEAYPAADFRSWTDNETIRKLASFVEDRFFAVDRICYERSTERRFLIANLSERVNLRGYRPFTVSARVAVVPGSTENPSTRPIGRIVYEMNFSCDVELGTGSGSPVSSTSTTWAPGTEFLSLVNVSEAKALEYDDAERYDFSELSQRQQEVFLQSIGPPSDVGPSWSAVSFSLASVPCV